MIIYQITKKLNGTKFILASAGTLLLILVASNLTVSAQPWADKFLAYGSTNDFKLYRNSIHDVQIKYPNNWIVSESSISPPFNPYDMTSIAEFVSPIQGENLVLISGNNPPSDLLDYGDHMIRETGIIYPNFDIESYVKITLDRHPGLLLMYSASDLFGSFVQIHAWTITDGKFYLMVASMNLSDFKRDYPTIQEMIDSFQTLDIRSRSR